MRCFHSIEEQEEFDTKTGRYAPDDDNDTEKVVEYEGERMKKLFALAARAEGAAAC